MRRAAALLAVAVALAAVSAASAPSRAEYRGIAVEGDSRFTARVMAALRLLDRAAPTAFPEIRRYVGVVRQHAFSGMQAASEPPVYLLADRTALHSLTWCASTIAHDAYHSKLYRDHLERNGGPVPGDVWTGPEAERKCLVYQREIARRIGAPDSELRYLAELDGWYVDLDRDGDVDHEDMRARGW